MNKNRFYKCTECDNLEDSFLHKQLTNNKKLLCRKCYKTPKSNPIIDFKKNREMK